MMILNLISKSSIKHTYKHLSVCMCSYNIHRDSMFGSIILLLHYVFLENYYILKYILPY